MWKYFKLVRIILWPASLFCIAVGFGAGADKETDLENALFGFLAMFPFLGFAYALNFYSDIDVDIYDDNHGKDIDRSKQPLLTGEVSKKECIIFCILTFLAAILLSIFVSRMFTLLMFASCTVGGVLYSHPWIRLKATPVGDIFCMGTLCTLLFSAGFVISDERMPTLQMILFFGLFSSTLYIPTVVSDYQYDLKAGLRTSAVVFGQRNMIKGMIVICILSLAFACWIVVDNSYPWGTKACVVFAWVSTAICTAIIWRSLKPPELIIPVISSHPKQSVILGGLFSLAFIVFGLFNALV